jgi:hypothetical protein
MHIRQTIEEEIRGKKNQRHHVMMRKNAATEAVGRVIADE